MDGETVQGGVQPARGGRAGLAHDPPRLGCEPAGGVGVSGLGERAHGAVEHARERCERVGLAHPSSSTTTRPSST
jgi:hypothetical protein